MPELDHNRIVSINADGDPNTNMMIGVYQGTTSLTVFSNRAMVAKFIQPRSFLTLFKRGLQQALTSKPGEKVHYGFSKFDFETKKTTQLGSMFVGRDDKALLYIGVAVANRPHMKFLLRSPLSFDTAEPMSDVARSELEAQTLIDKLTIDIPVAMAMTSFKREALPQRRNATDTASREDTIF